MTDFLGTFNAEEIIFRDKMKSSKIQIKEIDSLNEKQASDMLM